MVPALLLCQHGDVPAASAPTLGRSIHGRVLLRMLIMFLMQVLRRSAPQIIKLLLGVLPIFVAYIFLVRSP